MSGGKAFAIGPVSDTDPVAADRALRAVLARADIPAEDPRRLTRLETLDVLCMLGLVADPRDGGGW